MDYKWLKAFKGSRSLVLFIILMGLSFNVSFGQSGSSFLRQNHEIALEYLSPIHENRDIQTITLNLLNGWERYKRHPFTFQYGLTITYAWGNITQGSSNIVPTISDNSAIGIGPVFYVKYEPFVYKGISISPYLSGAFILYSSRFPHGGDIYNFMWRVGGSLHYRVNSVYKFSLSPIWMHVSNGQGISDKNPSYEGFGVNLAIVKFINPKG